MKCDLCKADKDFQWTCFYTYNGQVYCEDCISDIVPNLELVANE